MVAQAAATALSHLRDPRSWSRLIDLLGAKDPAVARRAHESLKLQTSQSFPPDQSTWDTWFKKRLAEEEEQFTHFQRMVSDTSSGNVVTAVDGLASLVLLRDQASCAPMSNVISISGQELQEAPLLTLPSILRNHVR
jgi:hypothetical protein